MVPQRPLPVSAPAQRTREVQAWLQALVLVLVLAWLQALVQVQVQVQVQALVQVQVQALVQALVLTWLQVLVQALVQALVTQSQQQPPWRRAGERRSAIGLPWCWR